ncbi:hypothetical protein [Stenotrophomonas geniculata]|uniref:hypothetical protein n=1 Tax=Stenotrophomonas geniculata TaxID=86188 RepID=UPI002E772446|nr:hypothetical protein [Stenotrophomonas geniculata]
MKGVVLAAFAASILAGCAATIGLPQGIPPDGYTELVSTPLGPFRYFRSLSTVPGRKDLPALESVHCANTQHEILLLMAAGSPVDVADTCMRIDAAAKFSESWIEAKANRYRILLAPTDTAATIQSRTLGSFSGGKTLALAASIHDDRGRTVANLVDLVAHETFHALGHATRHPQALDERIAYYAGLCAQLQVNGVVREDSLLGAAIGTDDAAVQLSSQAAYRVRLETYPLLADGRIQMNEQSGERMLQRCSQLRRGLTRSR